jgi:hypothetical protein
MAEMVLIYALNNAVWKMTEDGVPQICLSVPVESPEGKTENLQGCTAAPEEVLLEWLRTHYTKV